MEIVHPDAVMDADREGCPRGRHSRPPFLKSPTNSFFFVLSK
jgi:hypothetical protein